MKPPVKFGITSVLSILLIFHNLSSAFAVDITEVTSPGGIKAWLIEDHSNPIISMKFAFTGGSSVDPDGKEGLANLVAATIDEGAGDLDSQAFQAKLNDSSISLGFDAGREFFSGELVTLKKHMAEAFGLLNLSLTAPRFDSEPVERIRTQISLVLKQRQDDPGYKAQSTLRDLYYPSHVYGRPNDGTLDSLQNIAVSDMKKYLRENIARDNITVAVVGDIDAVELGQLLDQAFEGIALRAKPFWIPGARPAITGGTVILDEDIPQSEVLMTQVGISRDDPDYYAAFIVNHILGGGSFSSRLYQEVREKRGLAYSVGSYLSLLDQAPLLMASVATQNERVAETIRIMKEQWSLMAEEGPSEQELSDAKTYLTGSFPLSFTSTGRVANILLAMQLNDLGIDYLDQRNKYLEVVSLADAKRVAKKLFDADALTVVIAGRPVGIEEEAPLPVTP
ncbi:pitrilysin family protein [Kiloniella sp. EL199]|uniref:M16 family metallopeptidase n=1 Tax=Kiloniella sp. EL199 TaxID=2107581 RepID=UPI000EA3E482|nr:pitrilysin family protein [Kiloniella sp. EL199]